jgi:nucleoside-diphosphate-sugar epimerase
MARRIPDTTKLHAAIGWEPTKRLDDVLTDVIAYEQGAVVA